LSGDGASAAAKRIFVFNYNNAGDVVTGRVLGCNSSDRRNHAGIIIDLIG
jgi:hypothetical protein